MLFRNSIPLTLTDNAPDFADEPTFVEVLLDKEVPLTNNSGEKVKELRISPASKEKWGDNLLTKELENGETIKIHFKGDTPTNYWDIKMVDVNGKETVWATVEIFKSLDINLTMDQGMPSSECTQEPEK